MRLGAEVSLKYVLTVLRNCCDRESQKRIAGRARVSPAFVSDVLHGRREPTGKLLHYLGFERCVIYRKIL